MAKKKVAPKKPAAPAKKPAAPKASTILPPTYKTPSTLKLLAIGSGILDLDLRPVGRFARDYIGKPITGFVGGTANVAKKTAIGIGVGTAIGIYAFIGNYDVTSVEEQNRGKDDYTVTVEQKDGVRTIFRRDPSKNTGPLRSLEDIKNNKLSALDTERSSRLKTKKTTYKTARETANTNYDTSVDKINARYGAIQKQAEALK